MKGAPPPPHSRPRSSRLGVAQSVGGLKHRDLIYTEMTHLGAKALDFVAIQWRKLSKFCETHGERDKFESCLFMKDNNYSWRK